MRQILLLMEYGQNNNFSPKSTNFNNAKQNSRAFTARNWRQISSSGTAYYYGSGNNFNVNVYPASNIVLECDIPTACDVRTVRYTFYSRGYGYIISPNPASNDITISVVDVNPDPAQRRGSPTYEVQIFNRFNQLVKRGTCPQGTNGTVTLDISNLPNNQFYTARLISSSEVQTKSFFKG